MPGRTLRIIAGAAIFHRLFRIRGNLEWRHIFSGCRAGACIEVISTDPEMGGPCKSCIPLGTKAGLFRDWAGWHRSCGLVPVFTVLTVVQVVAKLNSERDDTPCQRTAIK